MLKNELTQAARKAAVSEEMVSAAVFALRASIRRPMDAEELLRLAGYSFPNTLTATDETRAERLKDWTAKYERSLAAAEALWRLVGAGALIPLSAGRGEDTAWVTCFDKQGGSSGEGQVRVEVLPVPGRVTLAPSLRSAVDWD